MLNKYWTEFRDHFKEALLLASTEDLKKAWTTSTDRTNFYTQRLLPPLAASLGLEYTTELFKVDFALCVKSSSGRKVPVVFIESENNAQSAVHEMWKLCSLSAPLKIMISCVEWSEEPGFWPSGGSKSKLLQEWSGIIKAHNEVWPQPCMYGVIIGEWRDALRFYSVGLGANGCELDPHTILYERQIS
jgi:hypothetical protein